MLTLPENNVDCLNGRGYAQTLAERAACAFWLHGKDDDTALFLLNSVHEEFAKLADALGYDVTPRDAMDRANAVIARMNEVTLVDAAEVGS